MDYNDGMMGNNGAESEDVDVEGLEVNAKSAILMEANTGEILYSKNASDALAPASVTKIMTLLLVAEAID
ncbi:MAG: D-alanyl-D-alanine carboxypeptidase, partial [Clostridia bacterium]|nr:D-alanyl-D-alanine carboxypeptidase [Clostridia bacterium]